jgi:hypothetical protein
MNRALVPTVSPMEVVDPLWGLPLQPVGCSNCGQAHLVQDRSLTGACPSCMNGSLMPQPVLLRSEPPELILPFQQTQASLLAQLQEFTRGVWLHTPDFTPKSLLSRVVPIYWPMWLVDGDISGDWRAEMGFDYQVKSSQESYHSGEWRTHSIIETRVRWKPRLGQIQRRYENIPTPAVSDHDHLWSQTRGYSLGKAVPYCSSCLDTPSGQASVRVPDLQPDSAWPLSETALKKAAAGDCQVAAGAQHVRNFAIHPQYDNLHWTQLLLPMYVTSYKDDDGNHRFVYINGVTATIGGTRLASQRKGWQLAGILAATGAGLFLIGLLLFALAVLFPPATALGALLVFLGFMVGLLAIIPAAWPWQWNRRQQ